TVSERTLDYHVAFHLIRPDDALRSPAIEFASRFLREAGHDETTIAAFVAPGRVKA
ncbi:LysR family transcriptional regulator, partial [Rhizobium ruizarguesonis]